MGQKKVIYVTNTSREAAFKYAHPRSHAEPVDLYLFDYIDCRNIIDIYENWRRWMPGGIPKPKHKRISTCVYLIDLYEMIASFGRTDPGSVIELHFFTHGSPENGVTQLPVGESNRESFERTINRVGKEDFKAGFAKDALVKLWGCGEQFGARQLTLSYWATDNKEGRKKIQQRVEKRIRGMYAFRLSELLGIMVWAAPPGWKTSMDLPAQYSYIDYWDPQTGPNQNSCWWRVAPNFLEDCGALFYTAVLGARIDPVGYVGINDQMSKAPPPKVLEKKPINSVPGIIRDYPGRG
jgi:hypothetical protein